MGLSKNFIRKTRRSLVFEKESKLISKPVVVKSESIDLLSPLLFFIIVIIIPENMCHVTFVLTTSTSL